MTNPPEEPNDYARFAEVLDSIRGTLQASGLAYCVIVCDPNELGLGIGVDGNTSRKDALALLAHAYQEMEDTEDWDEVDDNGVPQ